MTEESEELPMAPYPIDRTDSGIVIDDNSTQDKAQGPIAVTLSGIIVFLHPSRRVFVAVSIIALQLFLESYSRFSGETEMVS
jgi:hypothetical protein